MSIYNPKIDTVSDLQVMSSAAGFYVGRGMNCIKNHPHDWSIPYSRESGYFKTEEEANTCLEELTKF